MPTTLLGLEAKGPLGGVEVAQLPASGVTKERVKDMRRFTNFCTNAPSRRFVHGFNVLNQSKQYLGHVFREGWR